MRVYYYQSEYEPGKHKIAHVYSEFISLYLPEDSPETNIVLSYSVLELDETYNRPLARLLLGNSQMLPNGTKLPDRYYVNNSGQIINNGTGLPEAISLNIAREEYKTSAIYGMTQAQIDTYIDAQLASAGNVAQLKTVTGSLFKKLTVIIRDLVKQSRLDA